MDELMSDRHSRFVVGRSFSRRTRIQISTTNSTTKLHTNDEKGFHSERLDDGTASDLLNDHFQCPRTYP